MYLDGELCCLEAATLHIAVLYEHFRCHYMYIPTFPHGQAIPLCPEMEFGIEEYLEKNRKQNHCKSCLLFIPGLAVSLCMVTSILLLPLLHGHSGRTPLKPNLAYLIDTSPVTSGLLYAEAP